MIPRDAIMRYLESLPREEWVDALTLHEATGITLSTIRYNMKQLVANKDVQQRGRDRKGTPRAKRGSQYFFRRTPEKTYKSILPYEPINAPRTVWLDEVAAL